VRLEHVLDHDGVRHHHEGARPEHELVDLGEGGREGGREGEREGGRGQRRKERREVSNRPRQHLGER
jgi:hypothetical protein